MSEPVKRRAVVRLQPGEGEVQPYGKKEPLPYLHVADNTPIPISEYPDTPQHLFDAVQKTYNEAEEDLVKYVEKQIDLMENNLLFKGMSEPTFYALNQSLMNYESVMLGLIALHQNQRLAKDLANEKYDNFYAEKYVEIKQAQVNLGKGAAFTAAREIEMFVRQKYMKELATLKAEFIKAENKYNMINHLTDAWKNYAFVLNTLSKNAQAEAHASGISKKEFGDES